MKLSQLRIDTNNKIHTLSATMDPPINTQLKSMIHAANLILEGRKNRIPYKKILQEYESNDEFHLQGEELISYRNKNVERNKGLLKMFHQHDKNLMGVLVAGHAHVMPENGLDLAGATTVIEALKESAMQNFAVLKIKNP